MPKLTNYRKASLLIVFVFLFPLFAWVRDFFLFSFSFLVLVLH